MSVVFPQKLFCLYLALIGIFPSLLAQTAPLSPTTGALLRETFTNIPGSMVSDLRASTAFRSGTYTSRALIYGAESPVNAGDNYGQRVRGWISAPVSGDYTFYVAGDDSAELWLSPAESKFAKVLVAETLRPTLVRQWTAYPSQASVTIPLVAGQRYYVEALQKDFGSSDHLSLGWKTPGATDIAAIPAQYLTSYAPTAEDANDNDLPDAWEARYGLVAPNNSPLADPDNDGVPNWMEFITGTSPISASTNGVTPDGVGLRSFLSYDMWTALSGASVANLTLTSKFRGLPNNSGYLSSAESRYNIGDNFGERIRGTVTAPVTGQYTFWISGDDACELWLSTSASKFQRVKIAAVTGWTNFRSWPTSGAQRSALISLQAGQEYYIEILHKEAGGSDHVSVAWSYTGQAQQVIPGAALRSYVPDPNDIDDDGLPDDWEVAMGLNPRDNGSINPNDGSYGDPDADGLNNFTEYTTHGDPFHKGGNLGLMQYECWRLPSSTGQITDLTVSGAIGRSPDWSGYVNIAETPVNQTDRFGTRLRGLITAPVTGNYQFALASDDAGELWLSDSESSFGKHKIASVTGWTGYRNFTQSPSQLSAIIPLVAGHKYYIEGLEVEGAGTDHLSIAWKLIGQPQEVALSTLSVISSQYLAVITPSPLDRDGDSLPDAWEIAHGLDPNDATGINGEYGDPDADGIGSFKEFQMGTDPMVSGGIAGYIERQLWWNIGGSTVHDFISNPAFLLPPSIFDVIPGAESPQNIGDNYGERLRGLVTPPVTGDYVFSIAGDDSGELWLSRDNRKFYKQRIASFGTELTPNSGLTGVRQWTKYPSQRSQPIHLNAGQSYFIEVLHKEITGTDHVSIAWEYTDSATAQFTPVQVIPATALASYGRDPADLDDDYLPDAWELSSGLNPNDNGRINSRNGEQGDPDHDRLTNQQEFQFGTNPVLADTDGDGVNDYDEIYIYGSNPLVRDVQLGATVADLSGSAIAASSSNWHAIDDFILVSTARRGWVEYQFTTTAAGRYAFHVHVNARGAGSALVEMPLSAQVDGARLGSYTPTCGEVTEAVVTGVMPWLKPGSHLLRIYSANVLGNLSLQINAINIQAISGVDANGNGIPDWLETMVARENDISRGGNSAVSPLCLEGHAAFTSLVQLTKDGGPAFAPFKGVQNHWYKDIDLSATQPTAITAQFENGAFQLSSTVNWLPTNALLSASITLRKGDSLRLTAFPGTAANPAAAVQFTIGTVVTTTTPDAPLVTKFDTAGSFIVVATHTLNGVVTQGTLAVQVMAADFGPDFPVYLGRPRLWALTNVPGTAGIEKDPRVYLTGQTATTGLAFLADATQIGDLHVLARLPNAGPIVARGTLAMLNVSSTSTTNDTSIVYTYDNGDRLVRMGITIDDLPPGGYLRLDIFVAGVTFEDGTRSLILHASDFDQNGVAYAVFNYPAGTTTSVCHHLYVYDANNVLVGTR